MDTRWPRRYSTVIAFDDAVLVHDLSPRERDAIALALAAALNDEPSVRVAYLFGSFEEGGGFRDVDVAVWVEEPFSLLDLGRLAHRLWAATGRPRFELDVVPLNDAAPEFVARVAEEGRLLRERLPGAALEMATRARSDWLDWQSASSLVEHVSP